MNGPIMTRMTNSVGYMRLMEELRMHDWDDPAGTASEWYFATASVYWMQTGEKLNGFGPSPLYVQGDWLHYFKPDGYAVERVCEMLCDRETSLEDIKLVNDLMTRYLRWCNLAEYAEATRKERPASGAMARLLESQTEEISRQI